MKAQYADRRSPASKWLRYWMTRGKFAAVLMVLGWSLMALADGTTPRTSEAFEMIKLLFGGGILMFGMVGGVTAWVVDPAVMRGFVKHREEANPHPAYATRTELVEVADKLTKSLVDSHEKILTAISNLKPRRGGHE